jgi:hypothetical protein
MTPFRLSKAAIHSNLERCSIDIIKIEKVKEQRRLINSDPLYKDISKCGGLFSYVETDSS